MGAAFFIVLEREIDGLDTFMGGKSLSREVESLDEAARQLGVRPLSGFFSLDPEQAAGFMEDEGMDAGDLGLPPLHHFKAEDGLATVRALVRADHIDAGADLGRRKLPGRDFDGLPAARDELNVRGETLVELRQALVG